MRTKTTVWYLVKIRGIKNCFKIEVNIPDPHAAVDNTRIYVKNKTGQEVLECTTVDPYNFRTRAWKDQVILNRTYDSLPPKLDNWEEIPTNFKCFN